MDVFLALSPHLTDEAKLDRMIPYIVDLLHDESALVRASALRTLMQVVSLYPFFDGDQFNTQIAHIGDSHHALECVHLS